MCPTRSCTFRPSSRNGTPGPFLPTLRCFRRVLAWVTASPTSPGLQLSSLGHRMGRYTNRSALEPSATRLASFVSHHEDHLGELRILRRARFVCVCPADFKPVRAVEHWAPIKTTRYIQPKHSVKCCWSKQKSPCFFESQYGPSLIRSLSWSRQCSRNASVCGILSPFANSRHVTDPPRYMSHQP